MEVSLDETAQSDTAMPATSAAAPDSAGQEQLWWDSCLSSLLSSCPTGEGTDEAAHASITDLLSFVQNTIPGDDARDQGEQPVDGGSDCSNEAFYAFEEGEIGQLLSLRETITRLIEANEEYAKSLEATVVHLRAAVGEVSRIKTYLDRADDLHASDQRRDLLPVHTQRTVLPLFPDIYINIPAIAYDAKEVQVLRVHASRVQWTATDSSQLRNAVLGQCKKIAALQRATESRAKSDQDAFAYITTLSEEDLARVSLPDKGEELIDWTLIATAMSGKYAPEDCRTHWLMEQRPGVRCKTMWTAEQLVRLEELITQHTDDEGIVRDWDAVASTLDEGRLAIDCLSACQQRGILPAYAGTLPVAWVGAPSNALENHKMEDLSEVWENRTVIIAERLGTSRPKSSVGTRVARILGVHGSSSMMDEARGDLALIRHLHKITHVRWPRLFREPALVAGVDWSAHYAGRDSDAAAEDVEARWHRLLVDYARRPDKYVKPAGKGGM